MGREREPSEIRDYGQTSEGSHRSDYILPVCGYEEDSDGASHTQP